MAAAACAVGQRRAVIDLNSARTGATLCHEARDPFWPQYERPLDAPEWLPTGGLRVAENFGTPVVYGETRRDVR